MKPAPGAFVYAAVAYADIFGFPLTPEELHRWSIGNVQRGTDPHSVAGLTAVTRRGRPYIVLKGRARLVAARETNARWVRKKKDIANRAAGILFRLPTVRLVGITGGLAMENTGASDDIDFFIIAEHGTLWITRLAATLILDMVRMRRRPADRRVSDTVCLNMYMDESALTLPDRDRDLFAAHEVLQMKPIRERSGTYRKFLRANRWAAAFLPNAWREQEHGVPISNYGKNKRETATFLRTACILILRVFEPVARRAQLAFMRRRRTTEVVESGVIRFHPVDARIRVKKELARRLRKYNLPLDKFFYGR